MADSSASRLLLIVIGSALRAEEVDRPLGYYLRQRIEEHLGTLGEKGKGFRIGVVCDLRWMHDDDFQAVPTISIGGPGVNMLAQRWLEELPISMAVEDQYFVQMDPDLAELHVSIWGMENLSTQIAVSIFVDRFLPRFIERCLAESADAIDLDEFD